HHTEPTVVLASYAPMKNNKAPLTITDAIDPSAIVDEVTKKNGIKGMTEPNIVEESTTSKLRLASSFSTGASLSSNDIMNSCIAFGFDAIPSVIVSSAMPS